MKKSKILQQGDLIIDGSSVQQVDDALEHLDIAQQLTELVLYAKTPASIAIYGPWGAGKSWVGDQLRENLENLDANKVYWGGQPSIRSIAFIHFDAFKYTDLSLRRAFVKSFARKLLSEKEKKRSLLRLEGAYETVKSHFNIVVALLLILGCIAFVGAIAWALDFVSGGHLPISVSSGIGAISAVTVARLMVNRRFKGFKDVDEFEDELKSIISKSSYNRIVIFVDELDRCSPEEMVQALQDIRTFFDSEKCVIVVAVDREVLEDVLVRDAKHWSPHDREDVYYGTVGEYMDKVFQYGISIPSFWRRQGIQYAKDLIRNTREGFWSDFREFDSYSEVLGVLMPSHVFSPRRVKRILNSFVLLYRIAESRDLFRNMSLKRRYECIAYLSCLQTEFPVFARDMVKYPYLPRLVLQASDPAGKVAGSPHAVSEEAWSIALAYVEHRKFPSKFLVDDPDRKLDKAHTKELLLYLRRTENIEEPPAKLMYLNANAENDFEVPYHMVEEMRKYLESKSVEEFVDLFNKQVKPKLFDRALTFLVEQAWESSELDAINTIISLVDSYFDLSQTATDASPIELVAAIERILQKIGGDILVTSRVETIWNICETVQTDAATRIQSYILDQIVEPEKIDYNPVEFILSDLDRASTVNPQSISELAVKLFADDSAPTGKLITILGGCEDRTLLSIINFIERPSPGVLTNLAKVRISDRPIVSDAFVNRLMLLPFSTARDAFAEVFKQGIKVSDSRHISRVLNEVYIQDLDPKDQLLWIKSIDPEYVQDSHAARIRDVYIKWVIDDRILKEGTWKDQYEPKIFRLFNQLDTKARENIRNNISREVTRKEIDFDGLSPGFADTWIQVLGDRSLIDATVVAAVVTTDLIEKFKTLTEKEEALPVLKRAGTVGSGFNYKNLYDMSKSIMVNTQLTAESRFDLLNELHSYVKPVEGEIPSLEVIIADLRQYGDLALAIAMAWVGVDQQPTHVATVLKTMADEQLITEPAQQSARQSFLAAEGVRRLYRRWSRQQRFEFWDQFFKQFSPHLDNPQVISALALKAVDPAEFSKWLCGAHDKAKTHRQRDAIVRLWAQSNVVDQELQDALTTTITFDLLDRHLFAETSSGGDIQSALLGLLTVRLGLASHSLELNKKLEELAAKTPQLAVTVEAVIDRINRESRQTAAAGEASISK